MKTKVFKMGVPALAVLMGVGLAFATEASTTSRMGYYNDPVNGVQSVIVGDECQEQGVTNCKFKGHQVFAEIGLITPLRKPN